MCILRSVRLAAIASLGVTGSVAAQTTAGDLLTAARVQLGKGNADSGLVLIGLALDSSTKATASERVNALVWRGVLQYYKGRDSLARESFRDALTIDPRLEAVGLAQIDSILAVEFEAVRRSVQVPLTAARPTAALGRLAAGPPADTLYSCVPDCHGLDQPPRVLSGGPEAAIIPSGGAAPLMGGTAVVRFVVDTAGGVEPGSITVVSSPSPALRETLVDRVRPARFAPGRVQGRAVRVLLQWRLNLRSR